jgi:hypothetical protein
MPQHDDPPFYVIVIDEDHETFTVEGPLTDDGPWNEAVRQAQNEGRRVRCCRAGPVTRVHAEAAWQSQYGGTRVQPGSILTPVRA